MIRQELLGHAARCLAARQRFLASERRSPLMQVVLPHSVVLPNEVKHTMKMSRWASCAAAILLFGLPAQMHAQGLTTGAISGTVMNDQNQPVEAAQIQIVNTATGATAGAMTRADGRYFIQGLEIGDRYRVTARRIGFAPRTVEPVRRLHSVRLRSRSMEISCGRPFRRRKTAMCGWWTYR